MTPRLTIILLLIQYNLTFAQNVGINNDGSAPDNSAILDLKSTSTGLLIPRMTLAQRNGITSPETGLLIFQTDAIPGFYYFESTWKLVGSNFAESQNLQQVLTLGNDAGNKKIVNVKKVGIGTAVPDTSAALEIVSTNSGLLLPRMTNAQRNAIPSPVKGLMIFSLTDNCLHYYNGSNWMPTCGKLIGSSSDLPGKNCKHILDTGASVGNGVYWIDPDSTGTDVPFQCYCDMTTDGGGWTKLVSITYPNFFSSSEWESKNSNAPLNDWYSILIKRTRFKSSSNCYTFRLVVGNSGNWMSTPAHKTLWIQCHDPFTQATNGSDYTYISGEESTTCGGFNGLHNKYQGFSYATDVDLNDSNGCWWMQIIPSLNYNNSGYAEGYGGPNNYHVWQCLWVR